MHRILILFCKFADMDSANLFSRYVWLVDLIARRGRVTYGELDAAWLRSPLNRGGEHLPKKTFQNHCEKIREMFNVSIACDRKDNYEYHIENFDEIVESGGVMTWILNCFSISNVLNENQELNSRILFEKMPSGHRFVAALLECMAASTLVHLDYRSYLGETVSGYEVEPYCLKIFKRRWYLLGRSVQTGRFSIYSLDRIESVSRTNIIFHLPVNFNPKEFFSNYFGALAADHKKVETVRLKVSAGQQEYFRTIPWHWSQQEIEKTPEYSIFQYKICVTMDFVQEILSQSYAVEVLAPESLRETVKFLIGKMKENYGL